MIRTILTVQGLYYVATGIWPIVHIKSFLMLTGPKTDIWLVKMVGALALAIGIVLLQRAVTNKSADLLLAFLAAVAFAAVDIYYVSAGIILPVYLVDAGLQLLFLVLLFTSRIIGKR